MTEQWLSTLPDTTYKLNTQNTLKISIKGILLKFERKNWVKPNLKIKAANSFQMVLPSPAIFLFQWLSWALPMYNGMILLKF